MKFPNYNGKGITNLMASIINASGGNAEYPELRLLNSKSITKQKNIILILIDGMGYNYIIKHSKKIKKLVSGKITSGFPCTTASVITTIGTGVGPQQHGITGWFTYLKEFNSVFAILPYTPRVGKLTKEMKKISVQEILPEKSITTKIKRPCYFIQPSFFKSSAYNKPYSKGAQVMPYKSFKGFKKSIIAATNKKNKKLIYGYWPTLDSIGHQYGIESKKAKTHFHILEKELITLIENISNDSCIIITADHGLVDAKDSQMLNIKNYPKLQEMLRIPLCGDRRLAYCYIKKGKGNSFVKQVKQDLKGKCIIFKSTNLIKKGVFGKGRINKKFLDRIGDYTLIMNKPYTLMDELKGEERSYHFGNHGGMSDDELYIPLIIVRK